MFIPDEKWDMKLPPIKEIESIIFGLIYFYPDEWNAMCHHLAEFGIDCGYFPIPPREAIDAIRYGFIFPHFRLEVDGDPDIVFVFWNVLTHKYCRIEELNLIELSSLLATLNYGLWSYN